MRKQTLSLLLSAGFAWAAQGQLFDSGAGSYTSGDLAGQENWAQLLNHDTNGIPVVSNQLSGVTFSVDNSSWIINDAASDTAYLVETNASYVYLNEASAGNELYSEWTGSMDFNFSIPAGTYAGAGTMPNANFFAIGLTSSTTNGLSQFDQNDVVMFLRYRANNRLDMQLQTEADSDLRIFQTPSDDTTWAEPVGAELLGMNPQLGDTQSDELRLTWTIRKSTDGNYSAWGSVSNLSNGAWVDDIRTNGLGGKVVSSAGKDKSAAVYASSDPQLAMGRHTQAWTTQYAVNGNGLLDIDINDLTVVKSIVAPVSTAPANLSAVAYDSQVTVSWDAAPEATSYDVFRATSSGGYTAAFTNVTGLSVLDLGLANDTEYFYVVQGVYSGFGNSTNSVEKSAIPQAIFTGTLIDTDFIGYANGDLVDEAEWGQISGSSNNAFNVINSGSSTSAIDTVSTAANFSTNTGNAVYLEKLTDNVVYDAWEGHIDFQVSAENAGNAINNQDVLVFGVSANNDDYLHLEDDDSMALMSLKVRANGKLVAMFGEELNDSEATRLAVLINIGETGWDPDDGTGTNLVSDVIRYNWKIRKSSVDGIYQAFGSFSNITKAATFSTQTGVDYLTLDRQEMYDNPAATFVMGHYYKARLQPDSELCNVTVFDMSVTHTAGNLPALTAPIVATEGGDRSVTVSWNDTFEASSYDVLFGETSNTVTEAVESGITALSSIDSPRFNGVTGYYKVRANYPAETADSDVVDGTPEASVTQVNWDGLANTDIISGTGQISLDRVTGLATNVGNAVTYIDYSSTPLIANGASSGKYSGPTLYGLTQLDGLAADITAGRGNNGYRASAANTQNDARTISNMDYAPSALFGQALWYVKEVDWTTPGAVDATVNPVGIKWANKHNTQATGHRAAIRNGSQWYVSETDAGLDGDMTIANIADENWAPINGIAGEWMNDPTVFNMDDNSAFTDINAVGWFIAKTKKCKPFKLIMTTGGSIPSFEYWAGNNGLTNGIDGATDDPDGDGADNAWEYGLGGDPLDENDIGVVPEFTAESGGFTYVHNELRDPLSGINYTVEETSDLVFGPIETNTTVIGSADINYYWRSVTNLISTDAASKFIQLQIEQ